MKDNAQGNSSWTRVLILVGCGLFILALVVSAIVVPQLRLLHLFQGLIYVAVIALTRRDSAWGFGAGVTIATAWNSLNLFVTHLTQAGARLFWLFLRTGHVHRPETLMVMVGSVGHLLLIAGCLAAFLQLPPEKKRWGQFFGGGVAVLAYLALIVATLRPR